MPDVSMTTSNVSHLLRLEEGQVSSPVPLSQRPWRNAVRISEAPLAHPWMAC